MGGLAGAIERAKKTLHKVVSNSRFLICPWVKVRNLASHVLGQAMGRLRADWQERYGIEPVLLETFVDRSRFWGVLIAPPIGFMWDKLLAGGDRIERKHFC